MIFVALSLHIVRLLGAMASYKKQLLANKKQFFCCEFFRYLNCVAKKETFLV